VLIKALRTPTDFEATMGFQDYVLQKWMSPPPKIEPDVRGTVDQIFADLQYIGSDDPGLSSAYLEGIAEPLQRLQQFGLQLVAAVTSGEMTVPAATLGSARETTIPSRRAIYVVAPDPCYYRVLGESPAKVHKLGVDCPGMEAVTRLQNGAVVTYGSRKAVEQDYEGVVPWCDTCELHMLT
jgi:hypothetical protein